MKKCFVITFIVATMLIIVNIYAIYLICFPLKYKQTILLFSNKYGLESALVFAIVKAESDFDDRAVSNVGAKGLMQIMDKTAVYVADINNININKKDYLFDVNINIEIGCAYLKYLFDKFDNLDCVICAYNAGEGRVVEWLSKKVISLNDFSKIPYKETKDYYNKVMFNYSNYKNRLK